MGIENRRRVGSDCFIIKKLTQSNKDLDYFTNQFEPDDFYIMKGTGRFKEVSTKDFLIFRYGRYTFFKKEIYDKNWLDLWIDWTNNKINLLFLDKPFPPFNPEKIKIY